MRDRFWELPLGALDRAEWEALCDGCGNVPAQARGGDDRPSPPDHVACRLLDRTSCRCSDYRDRRAYVPDCVRLTARNVDKLAWLPSTCAYKLRAEGRPLEPWHYLISGDRASVHEAGISVRGWTVCEDEAGDLEHHLVDRPF